MEATVNSLSQCSFENPRPGCKLVRITGDLDVCAVPEVEDRIATNLGGEIRQVILDLSDLEFLDSTGIRMLLQVHARRRSLGGILMVPPRDGVARRAFDLVGMSSMVPTAETLSDALHTDGCLDRGSMR